MKVSVQASDAARNRATMSADAYLGTICRLPVDSIVEEFELRLAGGESVNGVLRDLVKLVAVAATRSASR